MPRYRITTLIDITRAEVARDEQDLKKQSQRSNFNSLIQAIGLRANPEWVTDPRRSEGRLPEPFNGKGSWWVWEFDAEREDIFLKDKDPVGLLKDDLHGVPIIANLEETAEIQPAIFNLENSINTHVEII